MENKVDYLYKLRFGHMQTEGVLDCHVATIKLCISDQTLCWFKKGAESSESDKEKERAELAEEEKEEKEEDEGRLPVWFFSFS